MENVNTYSRANNIYNGPNQVYAFDWVALRRGASGGTQQQVVHSNVFWNVRDMIYVNVSARVSITEEAFNSNQLFCVKLPFKMFTTVQANTSFPFGTPVASQRGYIFRCYGAILDHKLLDIVSFSNFSNTGDFYNIASQYDMTGVGTSKFISCDDVYNRTMQYYTTFCYKAQWPLERVP